MILIRMACHKNESLITFLSCRKCEVMMQYLLSRCKLMPLVGLLGVLSILSRPITSVMLPPVASTNDACMCLTTC